MSKIGLVVCGNSGIDYIDHPYDIRVIRSTLIFGEEEYTDFVDIQADAFYQMLRENPDLHPTTAQTATGEILDTYEKLKKDGYEEIIVVTISAKLSGTYEGARIAGNMLEGVPVHVFDSKSVAYGEAYMILKAAEMAQAGHGVPEIIDTLSQIRENQGLYVSVDTLEFLVKNGRLSGVGGWVGTKLKIKPMLHLTREGRIEPLEKIRSRKKAINRIVDRFLEERREADLEPFIVHANAYDALEDVRSRLQEARPEIGEVKDYPLTPVVGAHAGPGALAIGWIVKE